MDGSEVALEHIGAVEALLRRRAAARTETTDHSALVMCESVSVLVVLPGKALGVVLAGGDGALLGPLVLVGEHVRLEVLEDTAALWKWAQALLARLVIHTTAAATLAACVGMV